MIIPAHQINEKVIQKKIAIIGSGAGGSILAYLFAQAGIDCVVLEEGRAFDQQARTLPPKEITRQFYRDSAFFGTLGKPVIAIPLGKCLGGTTVINSGTCFQTPPEKIEAWQKGMGLSSLTHQEFETAYAFLEKLIGFEEARFEIMGKSNLKFRDGLARLGLQGKPLLRNTKHCEGCGFCCYGCPSGAKQSMDVSVIPKASEQGALFLTEAKVTRINRMGDQITSLAVACSNEKEGKKKTLLVTADIFILAAGAIFSPVLLMKSGIHLPKLGEYLTIHPTTKILALFGEKLSAWRGIPQAYSYEGLKKEGITFEGVFIPPDVIGATLPLQGPYEEILTNLDRVAAFGALIHDSHYGRVKHFPLLGTKAFYSLTKEDTEKFKKAIAFMARVYLASGAKKVWPLINRKNLVFCSEIDVKNFESQTLLPQEIESMGFHPLGTCRMGLSRNNSVVDQNAKVHGIKNLYIGDGSIVPGMLGVNPQITIMNFAHRLGTFLGHQLS